MRRRPAARGGGQVLAGVLHAQGRPLQNGPAISAMAVNANPLSDTVITEATTIIATLTGEPSQSVSANVPSDGGRDRDGADRPQSRAVTSDQRPAAIRPPAPNTWVTVMRAPADAADHPRSVISHTSAKVHSTDWGTTSRRRRRGSASTPSMPGRDWPGARRGLAAGGRGGIDHGHRANDRGNGAHNRREQQRRRDAVARRPRNHQGAQSDPERRRGLADAHDQSALIRREPADHQPAAGRIAACGRHPAEKQEAPTANEGVADAAANAAAAMSRPRPRVNTMRSPTGRRCNPTQ